MVFLRRAVLIIVLLSAWAAESEARQRNAEVHQICTKALTLVQSLPEEDDKAYAIAQIARTLARNGEHESSYELFEEVIAAFPQKDQHCRLGEVAAMMAESGFYRDAIRIVNRIRADEQYDEDDTDWALFSIARRLGLGGELDSAEEACFGIADEYIRAITLADVGVGAWKHSDHVKAERLVMLAVFYANQVDSVSMRLGLLDQVVEILVQGGMADAARRIVDGEKLRANESIYAWTRVRSMAATCGSVQGVRNAETRLRKLMNVPFAIWEKHEEIHYLTDVTKAQAYAGDFEDAMETAAKVCEYKYHDLYVSIIAEEMIMVGRLADALAINETIDPARRDAWTYIQTILDVASAEYRNGNLQKSEELLKIVRRHLDLLEESKKDSLFHLTAKVHGELGLHATCETWIDSLPSPELQLAALNGLANGMLDRGNVKD